MGHAAIIKYDMLADSVRFQVGKIFGRGSTSCRTWNVGVNSSVKRRNAASRSSARSSSRMEEASWHDIRSDILCDLCILMHTYAYLCNMFQYSSSFFKILSYLWGGGYGCCIILHHVTYIMLHHLDCWQYWFRSMSNHFDPCCVCCSGEESEGRKGTGPSGPSRARDTRGTRWYSWHRPSVGFWQLGRIPLDRTRARHDTLKAMA